MERKERRMIKWRMKARRKKNGRIIKMEEEEKEVDMEEVKVEQEVKKEDYE